MARGKAIENSSIVDVAKEGREKFPKKNQFSDILCILLLE
jgi:hypothetical protein